MTVIGVLTENESGGIEKTVIKMLISGGVSVKVADNRDNKFNIPERQADVLLIPMKKNVSIPLLLDILILENPDLISYELRGSVSLETRLIYNADKSSFRFNHTNAISYGMTYSADVTVSSIDDKFGNSFVFCLQRAVTSMNGNLFYAGEFTVDNDKTSINEILPAITCAMLCDTFSVQKAKI